MFIETFHMQSREKNRGEREYALGAKRRQELKLNIMPGIKRNYPRYASIVSFMEFRRQPQRVKSGQRKRQETRGTETRWIYIRHYTPYIGVYVYILLRYSYRLQRRSRRTASLNILRYDQSTLYLRQAGKNGVNEIEREIMYAQLFKQRTI